jgi:hypothetical protein
MIFNAFSDEVGYLYMGKVIISNYSICIQFANNLSALLLLILKCLLHILCSALYTLVLIDSDDALY